MRLWRARFAGLVIGIVCGVTSSFIHNSRHTVTMCEIDADTARYAGQTVRLRAYISRDNGSVDVFSVCGKDNIQGASVDLEPEQVESLRPGRHTRTEETGYFVYEAILVGRFDPPDGMLHCFSAKYHISNAHIERILRSEELASSKELADWFESKSH